MRTKRVAIVVSRVASTFLAACPMVAPSAAPLAAPVAFGVLASACGGKSSEDSAKPTKPSVLASLGPLDQLDTAETVAVDAVVRDMVDAHKCNRLTGCPGELALMQRGKAAVPALMVTVAQQRGADGYWLERLIDLLGQLDDPRPMALLAELASDKRWGIRVTAIRALGRLDRHVPLAVADQLRAALPDSKDDRAWRASLHFALARIDNAHRNEHRKALAGLLPRDRASVELIPNPMLDVTISLCGEARLLETAPGMRWAALTDNRFVAVTAAQTLAIFRDTGAIPYLLQRLEDPQPGIRRAALAAVQDITGNRDETRPAAWREWAKRYKLDTIPGDPNGSSDSEPTSADPSPIAEPGPVADPSPASSGSAYAE